MVQLSDKQLMNKALLLARHGQGWTYPNPMVGAVIVKGGRIVSQGYHQRVGSDHAEVAAIKASKESLAGAALYVSLEPCCHYGRTPPCVDQIIDSGIKRVVCASLDPNPQVNSQGLKRLSEAGIEVVNGILEEEAKQLNEAYFYYHQQGRPFVAVKFAISLDGKLATKTKDSKWITNEAARIYARSLRSQYQAILVGSGTLLTDDPHLGSREPAKYEPLRIVLDSRLSLPLSSQVLRDDNVLIATTETAPLGKISDLKAKGVKVLVFKGSSIPIKSLLKTLHKLKVVSILVEGGGQVLGSFFDSRLVDKVYAFYAPIIIGGQQAIDIGGEGVDKVSGALNLDNLTLKRFSNNLLITGYTK
jgi:diaminohydroxyphosphoribosylaminopyrimidine deaminase / 5-amino-6-(5-phosphoribosylamino)uracil reductase